MEIEIKFTDKSQNRKREKGFLKNRKVREG